MKQLRIAFLGTPDFAAKLLDALARESSLQIDFVLTQRDKSVGRKQILTESPVKKTAKSLKIPVFDSSLEKMDLKSLDLVLVYAYGKIIPAYFLQQPRYGFINIHPSPLPKFRGPSPIAYPLFLGGKKTAVTIIQMDEKVDHGPIIKQEEISILPYERRSELEKRLSELGSRLFLQVVGEILTQKSPVPLPSRPQSHGGATFTRLLRKDDGYIPFETLSKILKNTPPPHESPLILKEYSKYTGQEQNWNQVTLYNLFRGLYPWPGIWTKLPNDKRLKITDMEMKDNHLILKKVQLEGKQEVDFATFERAYHIFD